MQARTVRQPNQNRRTAIAKKARRLLVFDLENSYFRSLTKIAVGGLASYAHTGWRLGKYKTPISTDEIEFVCIELMGIVRRTQPIDIYGEPTKQTVSREVSV